MRNEDKIAIARAISILKQECQQHKCCYQCKFYNKDQSIDSSWCSLDKPPMHYEVDEIIKMLEDT